MAALAVVGGLAGVMRGPLISPAVQSRARIGALTDKEAIGCGAVQAHVVVRTAATSASAQVVRIAERARRLGR